MNKQGMALCFTMVALASLIACFSVPSVWAGQAQDKGIVRVRLPHLIHEAVRRNASVVGDYLQARMSRERISAEEGAFEPVFQTSLNRSSIHVPNSTEDLLTRQQAEYTEDVDMYDFGINGIVSSGATWELKFSGRQRNSSTIEKYRDYKFEYDNVLKLSIGQPLLKGCGSDIAKARINLARVQSDIDGSKYEQKMMELVAVAIQLYWKLYGVQRIEETWERSLAISEGVVKDMELRRAQGRISKTELMEAQSTIITRRAELHSARGRVVEARNQLLTLLNVAVSDFAHSHLVAVDDPFGDYNEIGFSNQHVMIALEKWPEHRIALKTVEKERLQVQYAENQLLPQLDLIGSVSLNSLDQENEIALRDVVKNKYVNWSTGLKFSVPLIDARQARSGLAVARMRAKQADVELDALRKSLANSINTKIAALNSMREQLLEYQQGFKIREQLLEIERVRLKEGYVSLKNLLDQEEEYVNFQRKALSVVVNYKLAEATFEIALGTILEKYKVNLSDIRKSDRISHAETILSEPGPLEKQHLETGNPDERENVR